MVAEARSREIRLAANQGLSPGAVESGLEVLGFACTPGAAQRARDRYLDTRSRSLARVGLAARLREAGRRRILRVQPSWLAPELVPEEERVELGAVLAAGEEVGAALRRLLRVGLSLELRGQLQTTVELAIARSAWRLAGPTGEATAPCSIELRLDRITARRPGERGGLRFSELELELLEGDPAGLAIFVERLTATVPGLAPAGVGRRRRAHEHVGLAPVRYAPPAPEIAPLDSTDSVARRVCAQQLEAIRGYQAGARLGLDPEFVHKMRVATRRLRAALRTFAPCFDARTLGSLGRGLRGLADALGEVRDLDVQILDLGRRREILGAEPAAGWRELRDALGVRRERARVRLLRLLDAPRHGVLLLRASAAFAPRPLPQRRSGHPGSAPVVTTAEEAIARRAKRFLAQARRCQRAPTPEAVHQLRIRGKKLRYACEFFAPLYGERFLAGVARLSELQEALGAQQDLAVSGRLARDLAATALSAGSSGAYLHVLGVLAGASQVATSGAGEGFRSSWEAVGGARVIKEIVREVHHRAEAVRQALGQPPASAREQ
jgi:adenylate cyclase